MSRLLILIVVVMFLAVSHVVKADGILDCLGDIPDGVYQYRDVQGENIWLGYANGGWDLPMDTRGHRRVAYWYYPDEWEVAIYWFPSQPKNQYWFVHIPKNI